MPDIKRRPQRAVTSGLAALTDPPAWLQAMPDHLLARSDTQPLRDWLRNRGYTLSLLDLDNERRRRATANRKAHHD